MCFVLTLGYNIKTFLFTCSKETLDSPDMTQLDLMHSFEKDDTRSSHLPQLFA